MRVTHADPMPSFDHPLPGFLESFVPLQIMMFEASGGPAEGDWSRAREFGPALACHGDHLLHRDKETARMAVQIVQAVATLAFVSGGVELFGVRYEGGVKG